MNLKTILISVLALLLFLPVTSYAQDAKPKIPFIQHNICPFECCQYGKWTARSPLRAFEKEGDDSRVWFTIRPGEEFNAINGNVHIVKLGYVSINKSFDTFKKGEKVYILSYKGEGVYGLWYKGKIFNGDDTFWDNVEWVQSPVSVWWVLVENKAGNRAWLKLKNVKDSGFRTKERIDGLDSCS
jgi:hypothetical protein